MYIETNLRVNPEQLTAELKAAGLDTNVSYSCRRVDNEGIVSKGHPPAVRLDLEESQRAAATAVLNAHVASFNFSDTRRQEIKTEAARRILALLTDVTVPSQGIMLKREAIIDKAKQLAQQVPNTDTGAEAHKPQWQ